MHTGKNLQYADKILLYLTAYKQLHPVLGQTQEQSHKKKHTFCCCCFVRIFVSVI